MVPIFGPPCIGYGESHVIALKSGSQPEPTAGSKANSVKLLGITTRISLLVMGKIKYEFDLVSDFGVLAITLEKCCDLKIVYRLKLLIVLWICLHLIDSKAGPTYIIR